MLLYFIFFRNHILDGDLNYSQDPGFAGARKHEAEQSSEWLNNRDVSSSVNCDLDKPVLQLTSINNNIISIYIISVSWPKAFSCSIMQCYFVPTILLTSICEGRDSDRTNSRTPILTLFHTVAYPSPQRNGELRLQILPFLGHPYILMLILYYIYQYTCHVCYIYCESIKLIIRESPSLNRRDLLVIFSVSLCVAVVSKSKLYNTHIM